MANLRTGNKRHNRAIAAALKARKTPTQTVPAATTDKSETAAA